MAAAADGPRLLSLTAVLLITARETLQGPEQLQPSALLPLLPQEISWKGLQDLWLVSPCRGDWYQHPAFPFCASLRRSSWPCPPGLALLALPSWPCPRVAPCIDADEASHPELFWPMLCCITELCQSLRPSRAATAVGPRKLHPDGSRNPLLPLPFQFLMLRLH